MSEYIPQNYCHSSRIRSIKLKRLFLFLQNESYCTFSTTFVLLNERNQGEKIFSIQYENKEQEWHHSGHTSTHFRTSSIFRKTKLSFMGKNRKRKKSLPDSFGSLSNHGHQTTKFTFPGEELPN